VIPFGITERTLRTFSFQGEPCFSWFWGSICSPTDFVTPSTHEVTGNSYKKNVISYAIFLAEAITD
jgi:hypothetical protein